MYILIEEYNILSLIDIQFHDNNSHNTHLMQVVKSNNEINLIITVRSFSRDCVSCIEFDWALFIKIEMNCSISLQYIIFIEVGLIRSSLSEWLITVSAMILS